MTAHGCGPKPIVRNKMVGICACVWLVWGCSKEGISVFPILCIKIYNEELSKLIYSDKNQKSQVFIFSGGLGHKETFWNKENVPIACSG